MASSIGNAGCKPGVAVSASVNREGFCSVPPRREASVATRNRERPGSHMLTGCPSVIKQNIEDRLSVDMNCRNSQSVRHAQVLPSSRTLMRSIKSLTVAAATRCNNARSAILPTHPSGTS
jgi:hypothetical protein